MLVLTRKTQQQIQIGDQITITVMRIKGQSVRIGIEAPKVVRVMRSELPDAQRLADAQVDGAVPSGEGPQTKGGMTAETSAPSPASLPSLPLAGSSCRGPLSSYCRTPGASRAPVIRRPQRLGPASLRSFSARF